jgi:hypothetical protein
MALALTQTIRLPVGHLVTARVEAFRKARADLQLQDELKFLQQMSDKGMSNDEQLSYRQAQLEREENRDVPDNNYVTSLKKEVTDIKKLVRYDKLRNAYKQSILEVAGGTKSLQAHMSLLQGQLAETSDPDLRSELQGQILQAQTNITESNQALLDNQVTFAEKDKSLSVIDEVLSKVKTEKAKALGAGNDRLASALDLKVQSLQQTRTQTEIENTVNQLTISKARKASSIGYLQDLSAEVQHANSSTPVVINGTRYNNAQAFWTQERDKYLATNFFTDLNKEYGDYITSVSQMNGQVPDVVLKGINTDFDQLAQRPEISPYLSRLNITKTNALADAVGKTSAAIYNKFAIDEDAESAISSLETLQARYGIDQTLNFQKIISDVAKDKAGVVNNLIGEVSARVAAGMSYSQAVADVNASIGKGEVLAPKFSAKELAGESPINLVKESKESTLDNLKPGARTPTPSTQQNPPTPAQAAGAAPATQPAPFSIANYLGQRQSRVTPGVTEFFNKETNVGYTDPTSVFKDFIGKRPSNTNPAVSEYFNKKNNQGFSTEQEAVGFANSLGVKKINALKEIGY